MSPLTHGLNYLSACDYKLTTEIFSKDASFCRCTSHAYSCWVSLEKTRHATVGVFASIRC